MAVNKKDRLQGSFVRTCVGCGKRAYKNEFIRVVRQPDGSVKVDTTGRLNGRSAYLCRDAGCLENARKRRRIATVLKCEVPQEIYAELEEMLDREL